MKGFLKCLQTTYVSLTAEQTSWLQDCIRKITQKETSFAQARLSLKLSKAAELNATIGASNEARFAGAERTKKLQAM